MVIDITNNAEFSNWISNQIINGGVKPDDQLDVSHFYTELGILGTEVIFKRTFIEYEEIEISPGAFTTGAHESFFEFEYLK